MNASTAALGNLFVKGTIALIWAVLALYIYRSEIQGPPLTVFDIWAGGLEMERASPPTVRPGDMMPVYFHSAKTYDCPVKSQFTVIDAAGTVWDIPGVDGFGPVGDSFVLSYQVRIPALAVPGPAVFFERIEYSCALGGRHVVTTPEVHFSVEGIYEQQIMEPLEPGGSG